MLFQSGFDTVGAGFFLWNRKALVMEGIEHILSPQSIAVVGASNRVGSLGLAIFRNLLDGGYQGILYPVNPKANSIQGVKAYPSLLEIPDEVDMAVLIVPSGSCGEHDRGGRQEATLKDAS